MRPSFLSILRLVLPAVFMLSLSAAGAAPLSPAPGQYVFERDRGGLTIGRNAKGRLTFEIQTIGAGCSTCEIAGVIDGVTGRTEAEDGPQCELAFQRSGSGKHALLEVQSITDTCRDYCGARATIDGQYRMPPVACSGAGREARREAALRMYRSQRYAEAASALDALISECASVMGWVETDWLRNDLALAQYHQGERAQCLATLGQTIAAEAKNEAALRSESAYLAACDNDAYLPVAKATWFNQALCARPPAKKR